MDVLLQLSKEEAEKVLDLLNKEIESIKLGATGEFDPFHVAHVVNIFKKLDGKIKNPDFSFPPVQPKIIHGAADDNKVNVPGKPEDVPESVKKEAEAQIPTPPPPTPEIASSDSEQASPVTPDNIDAMADALTPPDSLNEPEIEKPAVK